MSSMSCLSCVRSLRSYNWDAIDCAGRSWWSVWFGLCLILSNSSSSLSSSSCSNSGRSGWQKHFACFDAETYDDDDVDYYFYYYCGQCEDGVVLIRYNVVDYHGLQRDTSSTSAWPFCSVHGFGLVMGTHWRPRVTGLRDWRQRALGLLIVTIHCVVSWATCPYILRQ